MTKYHRINTPDTAEMAAVNPADKRRKRRLLANPGFILGLPANAAAIIGAQFATPAAWTIDVLGLAGMLFCVLGWVYSRQYERDHAAAQAARRAHYLCMWCPYAGKPIDVLMHEQSTHGA